MPKRTIDGARKLKMFAVKMLDMYHQGFGEIASQVIDYLVDNGPLVPEEVISRSLNARSNDVRKVLQVLSEHGLISFRRVANRDRERQGWYIDVENLEHVIKVRLEKVLEKLKAKMEAESNVQFYYCQHDGSKYTIDEAIEYEFTCPRCGMVLEEYNGVKAVEFLKKNIENVEAFLKGE
ncbi:MAG: hypothetical protein RMI83_02310 [Desulfurococcaceae archaeon]|nr:transcription factor [Sulfolobales archaeon]MDW8169919.1 hypothetical protein [Desulfurococcaceae archaeon]